jgi:germination protein M
MNKKTISLLCSFILIFVSITLFGCKNEEEKASDESGYRIYYTQKDEHKLAVDYAGVEGDNMSELVGSFLSLLTNPTNTSEYSSALNNNVKIIDYSVTDNIVYLNFTSTYSNQSVIDEVLCRAALVLTLTQIDGVDFVGMNINGQPLLFKNNTASLMKASDFADISDDSLVDNSTIELTVYFANEAGDKLKASKETINFLGDCTLEKCIVERLIAGPKKSGYYNAIPTNVKVVDAYTRGNVCYVYFDNSINEVSVGIKDDILIYSIVNTLSELSYISNVQIIIDGDPLNKLHETYSVETAFSRNLDLVEETKK